MFMRKKPLVSLITVNFNQSRVTAQLLESLSSLRYPRYEVIVVDNASTEPSAWLQERYPFIRYLVSSSNTGFAGGNNLGLQHASGEYVFFINNDTEVTPDLVDVLVSHLQAHRQCGIACPKIKFHDQPDTIQYAGCTDMHPLTSRTYATGSMQKDRGQYDYVYRTGMPHGAAMLIPRKVIAQVGKMAERFFLYYEELDWAARIKAAGYEVHYVGTATIYHKESVSTGRHSPFKTYFLYRNRLLYIRRNFKGLSKWIAGGFLIAVSIPLHLMKFLAQRETGHLKAVAKALWWNLRNPAMEAGEAFSTPAAATVLPVG